MGRTSQPRFGVVTLNPALDCTLRLDRPLHPGGVHGIRAEDLVPGGKGVNVARLLAARGMPVTLGGLIGRGDATAFRGALPAPIRFCMLSLALETRRNLMLLDGRHEYKLNRPGFSAPVSDFEAVATAVARVARASDIVILSGSLPPGLPANTYARLIAQLRTAGKRTVLDTSGPALTAGVAAGPDAIKPNREECEQLIGEPCRTRAALRAALFRLSRRVPAVVISDGARGAWFAAGDSAWFAASPPVTRVDSTAAGDSLLAQWCLDLFTRGMDAETAARAVAAGAAAVETLGSACPRPERIDALAPQAHVRRLRHSGALQIR